MEQFFSGFICGALICTALFGVWAYKLKTETDTIIGKLEIDLKYLRKRLNGRK